MNKRFYNYYNAPVIEYYSRGWCVYSYVPFPSGIFNPDVKYVAVLGYN